MEPFRQSLGGCIHPQEWQYLPVGLDGCGQPAHLGIRTTCSPAICPIGGAETRLRVELTAFRGMCCHTGRLCSAIKLLRLRSGNSCGLVQHYPWKRCRGRTPWVVLPLCAHGPNLQPDLWTLPIQHLFDTVPTPIRCVGRLAAAPPTLTTTHSTTSKILRFCCGMPSPT